MDISFFRMKMRGGFNPEPDCLTLEFAKVVHMCPKGFVEIHRERRLGKLLRGEQSACVV